MKRNQSREDYLEAIFLLGRDGKPVHAADIARAMKFTPVSVGNMIPRLVKDSVVKVDNMKLIYLTEEGYERAVNIYEKHVCFMNFLMGLGVEREEASDIACAAEHVVSDELFKFIKEAFSKPPCGRLGFCPGIHMECADKNPARELTQKETPGERRDRSSARELRPREICEKGRGSCPLRVFRDVRVLIGIRTYSKLGVVDSTTPLPDGARPLRAPFQRLTKREHNHQKRPSPTSRTATARNV
jgi:Mn-dependent DtxR family transcriptional regulator